MTIQTQCLQPGKVVVENCDRILVVENTPIAGDNYCKQCSFLIIKST